MEEGDIAEMCPPSEGLAPGSASTRVIRDRILVEDKKFFCLDKEWKNYD